MIDNYFHINLLLKKEKEEEVIVNRYCTPVPNFLELLRKVKPMIQQQSAPRDKKCLLSRRQ